MSKVTYIKPQDPFILDEHSVDGSRESGEAWLCVDKKHFMKAGNGAYVNIQMTDDMAAKWLKSLAQYFARRVKRV